MNKPIYDYFPMFILAPLFFIPPIVGTIILMCFVVDIFFYLLIAIPVIAYSAFICYMLVFETFKTRCFITHDRLVRETRKTRTEILRKDIQLIAIIAIGFSSYLYVIYPKDYPKDKIDKHFSMNVVNITRQSLIRNDPSLISFAYCRATNRAMQKYGYKPTKRLYLDGYGLWSKASKVIELNKK